jgi:hypothetical protein
MTGISPIIIGLLVAVAWIYLGNRRLYPNHPINLEFLKKIIALLIPFIISAIFMIAYYKMSAQKQQSFITFSVIPAIVNLIIMSIGLFFSKDDSSKKFGGVNINYFAVIFALIIPIFMYFTVISQVLSNNLIPGNY